MNGTFVIDCISTHLRIAHIILIGEVLWRTFLVLREYISYWNHYEGDAINRFTNIIKRAYGTNRKTFFMLRIIFCATCVIISKRKFPFPSLSDLITFVPFYWMYRYINMCSTDLQYADWIRRDESGLDYATGMASNYFYGYLKLILPSHTQYGNIIGIRERIQLYEAQEDVKFALKRLIILIPSDMYMDGKIESPLLTRDGVKPLETVIVNRAGVARSYKNNVYRFTVPINDTIYYIALEGATPLLSFHDIIKHESSEARVRLMYDMKKEIVLKFYRHLKYLLNEWPETQNEVELILFNYKCRQDIGEVLMAHLTNILGKGTKR